LPQKVTFLATKGNLFKNGLFLTISKSLRVIGRQFSTPTEKKWNDEKPTVVSAFFSYLYPNRIICITFAA